MERLFVYGTLRPGSNAHIMDNIGGEWQPGYVQGLFYERGWGAAADFPDRARQQRASGRRLPVPVSCATGQCWMRLKRATTALPLTLPWKTASA
jgi:hypothetical protein